ncbi:hypothetical protein [Clostridium gasigenes]|uniref:hypothetical protein n=1 Tax=Clostridium gasigenes TaxID=94869 RepID=UPI001C0E459F|nr:hypothetical protein [Clostridium gasigenes]MBU3103066.1 hypothetical protein [Clostridium gasigenes]
MLRVIDFIITASIVIFLLKIYLKILMSLPSAIGNKDFFIIFKLMYILLILSPIIFGLKIVYNNFDYNRVNKNYQIESSKILEENKQIERENESLKIEEEKSRYTPEEYEQIIKLREAEKAREDSIEYRKEQDQRAGDMTREEAESYEHKPEDYMDSQSNIDENNFYEYGY